jgi:acyl-CoA synthetase (AMP-forming)/AMP-acid ligase II
MLAIYRAGGVYVPLNPRNHIDENTYIVQQGEVTTVFHDKALEGEVAILRKESAVTRTVCLKGETPTSPSLDRWITPGAAPEPIIVDRDEVVSIYSTGGTTGRPKGVMFTPLTWEVMAANFFASIPCIEPPTYLIVSPITHAAGTFGLLLFSMGATIIVHSHFNAEDIISAIETHKITHFYLPPTAIYMLLSHPGVRQRDFSSLKCFIYTSAPMSADKLKESIEVFGPVMVQFWGQTEVPCFCTCLTAAEHSVPDEELGRRLKSCGRPMLLTPVEVMDDDGRILPPGERGELVARGNLVMKGYYKNPEATAEVSRFGWHHTGDIGYKDEAGFFYLIDRKKDMIITGGFNVFPGEVERAIWGHPAVQECAVVGVPDDKWGEAVTAIIELKPGHSLSASEIIEYCKSALGSVKAPKSAEFWDILPRTPVGKVNKKEIRAKFWVGRDRAI